MTARVLEDKAPTLWDLPPGLVRESGAEEGRGNQLPSGVSRSGFSKAGVRGANM